MSLFRTFFLLVSFSTCCLSSYVTAKEPLRILTWEGYVTDADVAEVNQLLSDQAYDYEVSIVEPFAEGAEQMFDIIRGQKADISFLTLFFIKMENEQTARFLQPIDINSPRLTNYQYLLPNLTHIPMGLSQAEDGKQEADPLYIPWGGGTYGFYIDRNRVKQEDVPTSVKELWLPKWKKRFSLNQSQAWYNIGLALMAMEKSPFYLHELVGLNRREEILDLMGADGILQKSLDSLYANAGDFWQSAPEFNQDLSIVSSWGPEIQRENKQGGNWQMIKFDEGNMVWLDTINFVKGIEGRKLEAAEIFANYFIGKKVQERITRELSMIAASSQVIANEELGDREEIFNNEMFVPPYDAISYSIMKKMTDRSARFIK